MILYCNREIGGQVMYFLNANAVLHNLSLYLEDRSDHEMGE